MTKCYCKMCGKALEHPTKNDLKRGYGYCSKECLKKMQSEQMASMNRKYASKRMKEHNPMAKKEVREKVSKTLKSMHWQPQVRGGNGTGATKPQETLFVALAERHMEVKVEYAIPTGMKRKSGYPTCYKVDIAIPSARLAIEVDGNSHYAIERQKQDKKKDIFLNGLGWQVLRLKNKQVMEHLPECVELILSTISK